MRPLILAAIGVLFGWSLPIGPAVAQPAPWPPFKDGAWPPPLKLQPALFDKGPGRYPAVPFKAADVELLFKEQLGHARDLDLAHSLIEQMRKNKDTLNLLSGLKINPDDPKLLETIRPLVKDLGIDKKLTEMSVEELKELKNKLEALAPGGQLPVPQRDDGTDSSSSSSSASSATPAGDGLWLSEEKLGEMFRSWLEGLDQSRLGDFLKDSPAWQGMISEFQTRLSSAGLDGTGGWKLDPGFIKESLQRIQSVPPVQLPAFRLPAFNLGRLPAPSFGTPGGGGGGITFNTSTLLGLVLLAVGLGLVYFLLRHVGRGRSVVAPSVLGPWPVDPAQIATRTELRLAFEYLALLRLGEEARTWNHRQVAAGLGNQEPQQNASTLLARLYEQARYTEGPDQLAPPEIEQARTALGQLLETTMDNQTGAA